MKIKPAKKDRRVRLTRQRLHQALLSLAIERGYDAVTVQDVLDQAEIARSTFYAHFRDKEDLLLSGFRDQESALFCSTHSGSGVFTGLALALFQHVYENKALAMAFSGSPSSQMIFAHLRNMIIVEVRERLNAQSSLATKEIPDELIVQFVGGTLFNLLIWWIDHNFPYSAQEMGNACEKLITRSLEFRTTFNNESI